MTGLQILYREEKVDASCFLIEELECLRVSVAAFSTDMFEYSILGLHLVKFVPREFQLSFPSSFLSTPQSSLLHVVCSIHAVPNVTFSKMAGKIGTILS
jgi:hypothetical protein